MAARHLYILDLDRTIFDTHRFFAAVRNAIITEHQLDPGEFDRTMPSFTDPESGYDAHKHYTSLTNRGPDQLDELIQHKLHGQDFAYADATTWIKARNPRRDDVVILTTGIIRYQKLKFHHAPITRELHKVIVATNKGAIIRRHLHERVGEYNLDFLDQPYSDIMLIDDSAGTFTALGPGTSIIGVRICRPGEKYSNHPTPPHVRHIVSFGELA
jgi:FMN phosphatase YigB (HAD superfamily)